MLAILPAAPAYGALKAGAAQADITQPIGTPMFAYTARSRVFGPDNNSDLLQVLADPDRHLYAKSFVPSKGIHTRLKARALVLETKEGKFALAQVDLGGIPHGLVQEVVRRIGETGISDERLLISATHTHSAHGNIWPNTTNVAYGALGGDFYDQRTFESTAAGIAEAIAAADRRLRRARAGVATVRVDGASRNRATKAFDRNASKPPDAHDPDLTVVRVDGANGDPIAVWSNFAIHATSFGSGNLLFSGDNPGYTTEVVEEAIGDGAVNVWTNGNEGDISPDGGPRRGPDGDPLDYTSGFGGAHMAGRKVAEGVVAAWEKAGADLEDDLEIRARQSFVPFDGSTAEGEPVGPVPVLGFGGIVADGVCAPVENMAGPGQGYKMFLFGAPKLIPDVAPVSVWRLGKLGIVALPSEVTRTMGLRIRNAVAEAAGGAFERVILAGLTDGYLSYTATPEEYDGCFYEGAMTLFGRRQGPRYRDFTAALAESLIAGGSPPQGAAPEPFRHPDEPEPATRPRSTPDAGTVVTRPAETVDRYGRALFRWQGGDRALEGRRGHTWIRLERKAGSRKWKTAATDATFADTVAREQGDRYVETFQFGRCDELGTYRFRVTGRALFGDEVEPYEIVSPPFELAPAKLQPTALEVGGGTATFKVLYPNPGSASLMALPRLVTSGTARLRVGGEPVEAHPDPATGRFTVHVPAGASVELIDVEDGCGNTS